jgi:hypothetical protein
VNEEGLAYTWESITVAVLMDIRRELRTLNRTLACHNFQMILVYLNTIVRQTAPKPRKRIKKQARV